VVIEQANYIFLKYIHSTKVNQTDNPVFYNALQNRLIDTERMLLRQVATGDQTSFTILFEHYSKTVYPFALVSKILG